MKNPMLRVWAKEDVHRIELSGCGVIQEERDSVVSCSLATFLGFAAMTDLRLG